VAKKIPRLPKYWWTGDLHEFAKKAKLKVPQRPFVGNYNLEWIRYGIEIEMEHTTNWRVAAVIAANHLDEHPAYYYALKKMEKELGI
jgi:hypothetical protein